jgi:hypothetical protein
LLGRGIGAGGGVQRRVAPEQLRDRAEAAGLVTAAVRDEVRGDAVQPRPRVGARRVVVERFSKAMRKTSPSSVSASSTPTRRIR